jgi:hypothetical protein
MTKHERILEYIANDYLDQNGKKPNFTNRDFMNAIIIFQTALMDKLFDNQNYDKMDIENRKKMAFSCGNDLRKLIHTYTNLDTHHINEFL